MVVALPALDEEKTIGDVIRGLPKRIPGVESYRVLVIDDGSRDTTGQVAAEAGAEVIRHDVALGVGAAFQTALAKAIDSGADLVVMMDADGQFDPTTLPELIAPVLAGEADFTTASRFKDPTLTPAMPRIKKWGNRVMSRLISNLVGRRYYDVSCGMRCYSRQAALHLHVLGSFTYTQEVFLNLAFKRQRIVEVPIRVRGEREFGTSRVARSLPGYAIRALRIILRCYRDYQPLRFFGTLCIASFMAAFALGSFFVAHYVRSGTFYPHTWAGVMAGAFVGLAVMALHMGVIGDMLNRHRIYLEELLYRQRSASGPPPP